MNLRSLVVFDCFSSTSSSCLSACASFGFDLIFRHKDMDMIVLLCFSSFPLNLSCFTIVAPANSVIASFLLLGMTPIAGRTLLEWKSSFSELSESSLVFSEQLSELRK